MRYLFLARCDLENNPTPELPKGILSWVIPAIKRPEKWYLDNTGLDSAVYLRQLKMCFNFMLILCCTVLPIIAPINAVNSTDNWYQITRFSLSSLNSKRWLWAPTAGMWIMSISWMVIVFRNYHWFVARRRDHFISKVAEGSVSSRTVMVTDIPKQMQDEKVLERYFSGVGVGEIERVTLVRDVSRLQRRMERRETALSNLERCHVELSLAVLKSVQRHNDMLKVKRHLSWWKRTFTRHSEPQGEETFGDVEDGTADAEKMVYTAMEHFLKPADGKGKETSSQSSTIEEKMVPKSLDVAPISNETMAVAPVSGKQVPVTQSHQAGEHDSVITIWDSLLALPRNVLDRYQPIRMLTAVFKREKVASIDYWLKKYNLVDMRVSKLRRTKENRSDIYKPKNTAFVTFTTHTAAQLCAQGLIHSRPHTCNTQMAPEPRDILWNNLGLDRKSRTVRYFVVNIIIWALTIFWLFPTGIVLTFTSYDTLTHNVSFLNGLITQSAVVKNFFQLILPVVLVTALLTLLPLILMSISKLQKIESYSKLEKTVANRYYVFSVVNVFIFFLLGYTFLQTIFGAIQNPQSILTLLGNSLPAGATFFIGWVVFQTAMHSLELIVLGSQLWGHVFLANRFFAPTPRLLAKVKQPWAFMYFYYLPTHLLVLAIVMVYAVINPLIIIAGTIYFGIGLLVYKHQFAYVYVRRYESGGALYRRVAAYSTDALILSQITIWGLLWIKGELAAGIVVIPLVVLTGLFKYYLRITFRKRSKYLAADTILVMQSNENTPRDEQPPATRIDQQPFGPPLARGRPHSQSVSSKRSWQGGFKRLIQGNEDGFAPASAPVIVKTSAEIVTSPAAMSESVTPAESPRIPSDIFIESSRLPTRTVIPEAEGEMAEGHNVDGDGHSKTEKNSSLNIVAEINSSSNLVMERSTLSNPVTHFEDSANGPKVSSAETLNLTRHASDPEDRFHHLPSRVKVNDNTSTLQSYLHPAMAAALNRKMWLPKDPLRHTEEEEWTVEVSRALVSSTGGEGVVGWWGGRKGLKRRSTGPTNGEAAGEATVEGKARGRAGANLRIEMEKPSPTTSTFAVGQHPIARYTIKKAKNIIVPSSVRKQYREDYLAPASILDRPTHFPQHSEGGTFATLGTGFIGGIIRRIRDGDKYHARNATDMTAATDIEELATDTEVETVDPSVAPSNGDVGSPLSVASSGRFGQPPTLDLNARRPSLRPSMRQRSRSRTRVNTAANLGIGLKNRDRAASFASKLSMFSMSAASGGASPRMATSDPRIDGEDALQQEVEAEEALESPVQSGDEAEDEDDGSAEDEERIEPHVAADEQR